MNKNPSTIFLGLRSLQNNLFSKPIYKNSVYSILDEGFFLGANTILHILLARWLPREDYGVFAAIYSVLIFAQSIYLGMFYEPLVIFGSGKYRDNFYVYLSYVLFGHFLISIFFVVVIFLITLLFFDAPILYQSLLGLSIAAPGILLLNIVRRVFYVELNPKKAVIYSCAYFILLLFIISIFKYQNFLSVFSSFLVMGSITLLLGFAFFIKVHKKLNGNHIFKGDNELNLKKVAVEHFEYGRWATSANLLNWFSSNIYFVVLPIFIGLKEAAAYRALFNFIVPIQHFIGALNLLFLPIISQKFYKKEVINFRKSVNKYTLFIVVITLIYWLFLGLLGKQLVKVFYAKKYFEFSHYLWALGLLPFISMISLPVSNALRVMGKPDKIFITYFITAILTILVFIFIRIYALKGAVGGILVIKLVCSLCIFYFYQKYKQHLK